MTRNLGGETVETVDMDPRRSATPLKWVVNEKGWRFLSRPISLVSKISRPFICVGWLLLFALCSHLYGSEYPQPEQGDYVIHDFRFKSGERLPDLRIHYRTLGTPRRDKNGVVRNA